MLCVPGSDAVTLVKILTNRTNTQRQVLAKYYEELTQKVRKERTQQHVLQDEKGSKKHLETKYNNQNNSFKVQSHNSPPI